MNQSNINSTKLKQSSSSSSTDLNNESCLTNGSANVQQTLDNNQILNQNTSNIVSFEELFGDIDLNQLNFEEVYAQNHCMNPSPTQLTPQQHEEIFTTKVSPNVDNILHKFFNKSLKLEEAEKLSESTN